jgi:ferredoxin
MTYVVRLPEERLPQLVPSRCIRCGDCVLVCPTSCLAMGPRWPRLVHPWRCVSCGLCVGICPTEALTLQPSPEWARRAPNPPAPGPGQT